MEGGPFDQEAWRPVRSSAFIPSFLVLAAVLACKAGRRLSQCWRSRSHEGRSSDEPGVAATHPGLTVLVEEKLLLARLERTKVLCHAVIGVIGLEVSVMTRNALNGVKPSHSQWTDFSLWLLFNFCILVLVRPAVMTVKIMETLMCTLPVLVGVVISPLLCSEELASVAFTSGNIAAIILCLFRRPQSPSKAPVFYLSMALFSTCGVCNLWYFSRCGWGNPRSNSRLIDIFSTQGSIIAFALGCGTLWERSDRRLLTNSVHLEEVRQLYAAASSLLSYSFDVMVEVDDRGIIVSPASELSSLVLRPSTNLRGTQLSDLFTSEADRVQFLQRLSTPPPAGLSLLESMAVGMEDASGVRLSVELLWFGFSKHTISSRCFMVGIRESRGDDGNGHGQEARALRTPDDNDMRSEPSITSSASTGSDEFSVNGDWRLCDKEPAVITVDTLEPGLPVRALSTSFILQFGRVPLGSRFAQCTKHPKNFEAWVQRVINLCLDDVPQREDLTVQLKLHQRTVFARCSWVVPADGEDLDVENICIRLKPLSSRARMPCTGRGTPTGRSLELGRLSMSL